MDKQSFSMTGQIIAIHESKGGKTPSGKFYNSRVFLMKQHTDDPKEVSKSFTLTDKYLNAINGFKTGDHVRVFFNIKTFNNKAGYPTTVFNAFKIEKTDAPAINYHARNHYNQ